ncbi:hypothetical protein [Geochorda subterranea]|uniref:DDE family transposase n=1 Tax=Geochorda subterranea TaxID=3109564 RepID=A0ABZ1BSJ7_9FIRM|nr:hypothetical protein [Limnochorda sp. LNt]WRP15759.1 hypothetical protein VLY81_06290 [Limnochorda sp. LNt]
MVLDTGFNSEANRRILQGAGDHYIIGEKLRVGPQGVPAEALRRGGKYRRLPDGLEIKEVVVGGDSAARRRFVIVRNPEEAERDRQKRESILAELRQRLEALKQKQGEAHTKAACELRATRPSAATCARRGARDWSSTRPRFAEKPPSTGSL